MNLFHTDINYPEEFKEDLHNKWAAFSLAVDAAGVEFNPDPPLVEKLKKAFALSRFIAQKCTRNPDILSDLVKTKDLFIPYPEGKYIDLILHECSNETDEKKFIKVLRRLRTREMVRIALRDIFGMADLLETMADLSAFADACVDIIFSHLFNINCKKYGIPTGKNGSPQNIVILGMGKLGAFELNFSSDIDLIFTYPEAGMTRGEKSSITCEEFFTRVTRDFLKFFRDTTPENILFRVDTRLRPFGESGPLVMNFNAMEEYYQRHGREWERYALIKARVVAGDKKEGEQLIKILKPFVYRRYLDYGAHDSLREMKQMIEKEVLLKEMFGNIKLGAGGIREVEFFGQIFQLIRGGVEPCLQERNILKVLSILAEKGHIPDVVSDELTKGYTFLRIIENRIQEFSDQQAHNLPTDDYGKTRLAMATGFNDWKSFSKSLENHMKNIHFHFDKLLAGEKETETDPLFENFTELWDRLEQKEDGEKILSDAGFKDPDEIIPLLKFLKNSPETRALTSKGKKRLNRLIPLMLTRILHINQPVPALTRLVDLIKTIERRTCYISLLLEKPGTLSHLIKFAHASPWAISFITKHPVLLDELLDTRTLYSPPKIDLLKKDLTHRISRLEEDNLEEQIAELAIFKQKNILHVAAADISGAFPLMKVSDYLTHIAEAVLEQVFHLALRHLTKKHGIRDPGGENSCFAVIGYGKFGGIELGYGSDLDLIFFYKDKINMPGTSLNKIDSFHYFSRLAQRIIHILTTYTSAGKLYETDMRLRPSGRSGNLVGNMESFIDYQIETADIWEHQALVRARGICGDKSLLQRFEEIRKDILCRPRNKKILTEKVISMRKRMHKEHGNRIPEYFNIKYDRGGIIDIEFMVQYLILLNADKNHTLVEYSDNIRQISGLAKASIIDKDTADFLKETYKIYRNRIHKLNLQEQPINVPENELYDTKCKIEKIWNSCMENESI